jgi:hypothetical protein
VTVGARHSGPRWWPLVLFLLVVTELVRVLVIDYVMRYEPPG